MEQLPPEQPRADLLPPKPIELLVRPRQTVIAPPPPVEEVQEVDITGESFLGAKKFNKQRGGSRVYLASVKPICNHMSTGIFALDMATLGGFPENTPFMIYGMESSAKTSVMMKMVGQFQRKYPDKMCSWIDAETTFDPLWAVKHGVDLDRLWLSQPETGEEGVDLIDEHLRSEDISFVVLDSVPALVPMKVVEDSSEEKKYGGNSGLIGNLLQKHIAAISTERLRHHYPTFGIINQIRDSMASFGSPYKIPGGRQLKHQVQTWVRLKGAKKLGKDRWGVDVPDYIEQAFVIEKNKVGSSIMAGEYNMALNPSHCRDSSIPAGVEIPIGQIYEGKTIVSQAKRMGLITGSGGNWRIAGVDHKFSKGEDIEVFLYGTPEHDIRLRQLMIGAYRRENSLPAIPPDGFLLTWDQYE